MNRETFLIIDGSNLLFQMYFGMPNAIISNNDENIKGLVGFIGAIRKIINQIKPEYLLVLFDSEVSLVRRDIDESYKSNRSGYEEGESPYDQYPNIIKVLKELNIKHYEVLDREADDEIVSYALKYCKRYKVIISSSDADFFQILRDNIDIFRYNGKGSYFIKSADVINKYGVTPEQFASFKALVGDVSDNIVGVKGIGSKTASKLLAKYNTLEEILDKISELDNRLLVAIGKEKERLIKNLKLIKPLINNDLKLDISQLAFDDSFDTLEVISKIGITIRRKDVIRN